MRATRKKTLLLFVIGIFITALMLPFFSEAGMGMTNSIGKKSDQTQYSSINTSDDLSLETGSAVTAFPGGPIIADHTVVDKYDDIPQHWIDEVKKMWIDIPGESHSEIGSASCRERV